jgi:S1-C subfamily serine protease
MVAGPKVRSNRGMGLKVTLGIIPDFTSSGTDGLGVDGVRPGGPAAGGGMQKGDIIVAVNGESVTNIYDYMHRLKKLEAGQIITVDVLRNNKKEVLLIQL